MLINHSQLPLIRLRNVSTLKTPPVQKRKKQQKSLTKIKQNKSVDKTKLTLMINQNNKFQRELINSQFIKLKQRLSPYKWKQMFSDQSRQTLSPLPLKLKKQLSIKQALSIQKKETKSPSTPDSQKNFTLIGQKYTQSKSIQSESSIAQINQKDFVISKKIQDSMLPNKYQHKFAYWISQNKYVSLFPISTKKNAKIIVVNHPNVLPLLGFIKVGQGNKYKKYIVTDYQQNNTLKNLLDEFGSLSQSSTKNYIRKIILGVYNLHKNRVAHNRLSTSSIFYTENGQVKINMLKASSKPLSQTQRCHLTHSYSPQLLLSNSNNNSDKNDIWSIGCIALQLLTNLDHKNNFYHPYNKALNQQEILIIKSRRQNTGFRSKSIHTNTSMTRFNTYTETNLMIDSLDIIQNVQSLFKHQRFFEKEENNQMWIDMAESIQMKQLSLNALDFIARCLNLRLSRRPNIDQLMFHPFLKE